MSQVISPIHTPCKKCVFAIYEDKTQTGCHLDFIAKFKNKNIEILEAYDEEKEFYVINHKKCLGYREDSWFEKRNLSHLSIADKVDRFKSKNYIHYLMVINLDDLSDNYNEYLITQLQNLAIKPQKIIFIRYQQSDKKIPYENIVDIINQAKLEVKWRIQTVLEKRDYLNILHEIIGLNKKYRFILSISHIYENMNLNNMVDKGNQIVYDDMDRFIVISNNQSCLLFSTPNYRHSLLVENKDILTDTSCHLIV